MDLAHRDPRIRVQAAKETVEQGRHDLLPELVENLEDDDGAVRLYSSVALRKLTGQRFGYLPYAPAEERKAAIERWREWLRERREKKDAEAPSLSPVAGAAGESSGAR